MNNIVINQEACTRDQICGAVCPRHLIEFPEQDSYPLVRTDASCFECGQCVAACPQQAVILNGMAPEGLVSINPELAISPEQLRQYMTSRRSIRNFKKKPVEREKLQQILDIASYAPTGKNWQLVNWIVIEDPAEVQQISGQIAKKLRNVLPYMFTIGSLKSKDVRRMRRGYPQLLNLFQEELAEMVKAWEEGSDRILRGAPHLIMAYGDTRNIMTRDACVTAMTHLELAAHGLGLGACWAGLVGLYAQLWPDFGRELGIPKNNEIICAMMIGYPKYKYHTIPYRNAPRVIWR